MKMGTYTFHWNTQQGHRFKRFSSFFKMERHLLEALLILATALQSYTSWNIGSARPRPELKLKTFLGDEHVDADQSSTVTSLSNTFSQHTTLCSLRLTQVPQPRIRMTKGKMLHMYAVAASIAFLLYMVILFSSNNNSLILLFTNGNPWLYHCSSFEICNCNHYSLRKGF